MLWASLAAQKVKNVSANAGDPDSMPGSGRSAGEGNGNTVQYPRLETSMDRGAYWARAQGVAKSDAINTFTFHFHSMG